MAEPVDSAELELVRRAIALSRVRGCCEWDDKQARRFEARPALPELTPEGVRQLLFDFVANQAGKIVQVVEKRAEWQDRDFYYKAVIPLEGLPHGLFVELILADDDPDYPAVLIVNAHEQGR